MVLQRWSFLSAAGYGKVEKRVRTTGGGATGSVRNLRIREDTAKYLLNLDPSSAHYDPKSRSMREDPQPHKAKKAFAGGDRAALCLLNCLVACMCRRPPYLLHYSVSLCFSLRRSRASECDCWRQAVAGSGPAAARQLLCCTASVIPRNLLAGSWMLLTQLVPSAGDNFVRKNGDYSAWESLTQHQLAAIDHGANMHMQAAPSQAEILFQNFKTKKGALQVSSTGHCSCGPCQTACTLGRVAGHPAGLTFLLG